MTFGSISNAQKWTQTIAVSAISAPPFVLLFALPLLVDSAAKTIRLNAAESGLLGSADLLGFGLATFPALFLIGRVSNRVLIDFGTLFILVVDSSCLLIQTALPLFAARFVAGLGGGVIYALASVTASALPNPTRVYGIAMTVQTIFGVLALWLLPPLILKFGLCALFGGHLLAVAVAWCASAGFPAFRSHIDDSSACHNMSTRIALLLALALFLASGVGCWAFVSEIAHSHGIPDDAITKGLAGAALASLPGLAVASFLGDKIGTARPIVAANLTMLVGCAILVFDPGIGGFLLSTVLIQVSLNFASPFQFGFLSSFDKTGRTLALSNLALGLGMGLGPGLVGFGISMGSFPGLFGMCCLLLILSMVLQASKLALLSKKRIPAAE